MKKEILDAIRENAPEARWLAKAALASFTEEDLAALSSELRHPWNSPAASYLLLRMVADTGRFPALRDAPPTYYIKGDGDGEYWLHHLARARGFTPYSLKAMGEFIRARFAVDVPPLKVGDAIDLGPIAVEVPNEFPPVLRIKRKGVTREYVFEAARADVAARLQLVDGVGTMESAFSLPQGLQVVEVTPRMVPPPIMENLPGRPIPDSWVKQKARAYGIVRLLLKSGPSLGFFVTIA